MYTFSTLFASGEVYISSIIDTITAQSYYNSHIVSLLNLILKGAEKQQKAMKMFKDLTHSNLWQIPAPEGLYNKTFNDLFLFMLENNLIAIALYRMPGATDNKFPYVWTNPEGATVTNQDRVFVLGEKIPKNLNLNIEEIAQSDKNFDRNRYIFTQYAEGDVVKNYYGETLEDEEDKYSSSSSKGSGEDFYKSARSTPASPKIHLSKLGENTHAEKKTTVSTKTKATQDVAQQQNLSSLATTKIIIDNLAAKMEKLDREVLSKVSYQFFLFIEISNFSNLLYFYL